MVGIVSFEDVQTHGVVGGIVQHEGEKIELQNGVEAFRELVEEGLEVALLRDGFADFEKRFELPPRIFEAMGGLVDEWNFLRVLHEIENSTRFGDVTTERVGYKELAMYLCPGRQRRVLGEILRRAVA